MKRIIIICEGPTEKVFCERMIAFHMLSKGYHIHCPTIKYSRGGIVKWQKLREQIIMHLKAEKDAFVTTLIDYYGLYTKHAFPSWEECEAIPDKKVRMEKMEEAMRQSIDDSLKHRFIPYIQLHEFEGLLFNDINIFYDQIPPDDLIGKDELKKIFADYDNPEMINNEKETAPSKRLHRIIAGYNKVVYGDILAESIGLERMRNKSPRFNEWISNLESI